jgi:hypothetical protein
MNKSVFTAVKDAQRALQELRESEQSTVTNTRHFDIGSFKDKLRNDTLFLESIYDEFIGNEQLKSKFEQLVSETAVAAYGLMQEADAPAKMITPAVEFATEPLTEEEVVKFYKHSFNMILEDEFNNSNISGEMLFEDGHCQVIRKVSPGATKIIKICVDNDALEGNDPEVAIKHVNAEQSIVNAIRHLFLPRGTDEIVKSYDENLGDDYRNIFGDEFGNNKQMFDTGCHRIGSLLTPFIFKRALENADSSVPYAPTKLAGLSAAVNSDV